LSNFYIYVGLILAYISPLSHPGLASSGGLYFLLIISVKAVYTICRLAGAAVYLQERLPSSPLYTDISSAFCVVTGSHSTSSSWAHISCPSPLSLLPLWGCVVCHKWRDRGTYKSWIRLTRDNFPFQVTSISSLATEGLLGNWAYSISTFNQLLGKAELTQAYVPPDNDLLLESCLLADNASFLSRSKVFFFLLCIAITVWLLYSALCSVNSTLYQTNPRNGV